MTFRQIAATRLRDQQHFHNGLPEGWNRDRFRQLCVQYAQMRGCGAQCVRTLEIIIDFVSPSAFKDTTMEPLCYARQETLLGGRAITTKTIYNHERELEAIGLIERRLGANGSRCKRKHLGLFLSPALNLIEDMLDAQSARLAQKEQHDRLRGDRSRLYRHVKATLTVLCANTRTATRAEELMAAFRSWPRSDKLINMTNEALHRHVEECESLLIELNEIASLPEDISGQPVSDYGCHIQDQIEDKILSCNADSEDKWSSGKPSVSNYVGTEPDGSAHCLESKHEGETEPHKPQNLPKITGRHLYDVASEEMRMHMDIIGGGSNPDPSLYEVEKACANRMAEIGTNSSAWEEAIQHMSLQGAILAAILTDAKLTDPTAPVANPGGYLRGMTRAAKAGELNLIAGWMGLIARRDQEERAEAYGNE